MATKRLFSPQFPSSISDVPNKISRRVLKKLCPNAKLAYFHHLNEHNEEKSLDEAQEVCRFLQISKDYLNDVLLNSCVFIAFNENSFQIKLNSNDKNFDWNTSMNLSTIGLILLSDILKMTIRINLTYNRDDKAKVEQWIKNFLDLKDHKTLNYVNLEMTYTNDFYSRIFLDLLCKKIKNIEIFRRLPRDIYFGHKIQLDQLKISSFFKDIPMIMQTNAQKIVLKNCSDGLEKFAACERLKPNPNIKFLKVATSFGYFDTDELKINGNKSWKERMPMFEKAIKCLQDLNPDMKLEIRNSNFCFHSSGIKNVSEAILCVSQLVKNIETFVDLFQSHGMKISCIKIESNDRVVDFSNRFIEKLSDSLKTKCINKNTTIEKTYLHHGVEIKLKMSFRESLNMGAPFNSVEKPTYHYNSRFRGCIFGKNPHCSTSRRF